MNSGLFKKGQSGNPNGRPKKPEEFKIYGPEAVERLLFWMRSNNSKASMQAITLWLAYWLGKPNDVSEEIIPVLQGVINEQQVLKLLYARNFTDARGDGAIDKTVVASRTPPVQA